MGEFESVESAYSVQRETECKRQQGAGAGARDDWEEEIDRGG